MDRKNITINGGQVNADYSTSISGTMSRFRTRQSFTTLGKMAFFVAVCQAETLKHITLYTEDLLCI